VATEFSKDGAMILRVAIIALIAAAVAMELQIVLFPMSVFW
jgi:hypothetical protein